MDDYFQAIQKSIFDVENVSKRPPAEIRISKDLYLKMMRYMTANVSVPITNGIEHTLFGVPVIVNVFLDGYPYSFIVYAEKQGIMLGDILSDGSIYGIDISKIEKEWNKDAITHF